MQPRKTFLRRWHLKWASNKNHHAEIREGILQEQLMLKLARVSLASSRDWEDIAIWAVIARTQWTKWIEGSATRQKAKGGSALLWRRNQSDAPIWLILLPDCCMWSWITVMFKSLYWEWKWGKSVQSFLADKSHAMSWDIHRNTQLRT